MKVSGLIARKTKALGRHSGGEWGQKRRRFLGQARIVGPLFVLLSTVLLCPKQTQRYPTLKTGDIAPSDVVVWREIVLPDMEATEEKRRRAGLEIPPVYVMDESVGERVKTKLEAIFSAGANTRRLPLWEASLELSKAAGQRLEVQDLEVLRALNFSREVLVTLMDLVEQIYRQGVVEDRVEVLRWAEKGVSLRRSGSEKEQLVLDVFRFLDAAGLSETLEERMASLGIQRRYRRPLASFLARLMPPNVILDRSETLSRRIRAASAVEDVVIHLNRGRVLLRKGDEVSPQMARILESLAASSQGGVGWWPILAVFGLVSSMAVMWFFYFRREPVAEREQKIRFGSVLVVLAGALVLEAAFGFVLGQMAAAVVRKPFDQVAVYWPALPHGTGPMLASLMFGLPVGVVFAASQAVLVEVMLNLPGDAVAYALLEAVAAAFVIQRVKDRNALTRVGLLLAGVNLLFATTLSLGTLASPELEEVLARGLTGALGGVITAVLAGFFLPVLENLTGTITDIRLLELSNPSLPLLRRLATEAPGTFQHSLAMANLAEAAAEAIGANPLLARVCCYYHDVGKLVRPDYFIENQRRGKNPHDHLSPWMSALVVSKHVKEGLELARKFKLPEPIREAIATHHGTKLIHFFYTRAKQQANPDLGEVTEEKFRYPGPKPKSKEMGIILLADAVEAAARTLSEATPGRVQGMIQQVMKSVLEDGQLDECELTLKDLEKISAAFSWVITSAAHNRIDYPGFNFNEGHRGR